MKLLSILQWNKCVLDKIVAELHIVIRVFKLAKLVGLLVVSYCSTVTIRGFI